jgi:hypothetical protein
MSTFAAAGLLDLWELGRDASPGERGLLLLGMAEPDVSENERSGWSVGRRDAALLALHERAFGPRMTALASCPRCAESLEMELATGDLAVPSERGKPGSLSLVEGSYRVAFRVPTAADLAALARTGGALDPERWLLERCILDARVADEPCTVADLPEDVLRSLTAAMEAADPQAEVELEIVCPSCGHRWEAIFDIVSFLWREVEAWAARLVREVHALASAYGWSEREILSLSPRRRRSYLELIVP